MEKRQRFDELDGYRGIAALAIVVFHIYFMTLVAVPRLVVPPLVHVALVNFDAAVAWFFVLSGFLIFRPLAQAIIAGTPLPTARAFLRRRVWRILPLYYAVILTVFGVQVIHREADWRAFIEHLTFLYLADSAGFRALVSPAWSLGDEVVFYLTIAAAMLPLAALCASGRTPSQRARRLATIVAIPTIGSSAFLGGLLLTGTPFRLQTLVLYNGPLALGHIFGLGMLLAVGSVVLPPDQPLPPRYRVLLVSLSLAVFAVAAVWRGSDPTGAGAIWFLPLNGAAFAGILAGTVLGPRPSRLIGLLSARLPRGLGAISYSLYLWHLPIIGELTRAGLLVWQPQRLPHNLLITLAIVLPVATASYYGIERPALRRKTAIYPRQPTSHPCAWYSARAGTRG